MIGIEIFFGDFLFDEGYFYRLLVYLLERGL